MFPLHGCIKLDKQRSEADNYNFHESLIRIKFLPDTELIGSSAEDGELRGVIIGFGRCIINFVRCIKSDQHKQANERTLCWRVESS